MAKKRILFSVVEFEQPGDEPYLHVEWHPDIMHALDEIDPDYCYVNKILDLAEEIRNAVIADAVPE